MSNDWDKSFLNIDPKSVRISFLAVSYIFVKIRSEFLKMQFPIKKSVVKYETLGQFWQLFTVQNLSVMVSGQYYLLLLLCRYGHLLLNDYSRVPNNRPGPLIYFSKNFHSPLLFQPPRLLDFRNFLNFWS